MVRLKVNAKVLRDRVGVFCYIYYNPILYSIAAVKYVRNAKYTLAVVMLLNFVSY